MSAAATPTPWEICRAVDTLRAAGAVFALSGSAAAALRLLSREDAAQALGVSVVWIKRHEAAEFPNRIKLPGGDVRIPVADIEAALLRWRTTR